MQAAGGSATKYTFAIVDKRGDGMMSGRQGSYALFDSDSGQVLARGGGNFKLVKMETLDIGLASSDAATADTMNDGEGDDEILESSEDDASIMILVRPEDGEEEEDKRKRADGTTNVSNVDRSGATGRQSPAAVGGTASSMLVFSLVISAMMASAALLF